MTPTHSDGLAATKRKPKRKTHAEAIAEMHQADDARKQAAVARYAAWNADGRLGFVDVPHHWVQRVHLRCAHGCGHGRMWLKHERGSGVHVCDLCGYAEVIEMDTFPHFFDGALQQHYPVF